MAVITGFAIEDWTYQSALNGSYTVKASETGNQISAEVDGLFARSWDSQWSKPDATARGVSAKSLPRDGSLKFRMTGTNRGNSSIDPVPRWAWFNATRNVGGLINPALALGYPSIPTGAFDVEITVLVDSIDTAVNTAVSASSGQPDDDIQLFVVTKLPAGVTTALTLYYETKDSPSTPSTVTPVGVKRPRVLRRWNATDKVEEPLAVDSLSGPPSWKIQGTYPFRAVPAAAAFMAGDPVRVMSFGDSQTDGRSADHEGGSEPGINGWVNVLAKRLGATGQTRLPADSITSSTLTGPTAQAPTSGAKWINCGFGGSTSSNFMPTEAVNLVKQFKPQVTTIQVGVNDLLTNVPVSTFTSNLVAAVDNVLAATSDGVVAILSAWEAPSMQGKTSAWAAYREAMKTVALARPDRVVFIDTAAFYSACGFPAASLGFLNSDNLHFNAKGHYAHAALVGEALGIPKPDAEVAAQSGGVDTSELVNLLTPTVERKVTEAVQAAGSARPGVVVIGLSEEIPPGLAAGTVIVRRAA